MKFDSHNKHICAALAACCLVMLTAQSRAKPPYEESLDRTASLRVTEAPLDRNYSPHGFLLTEWLSVNGSGGFPEGYSDEHRILDEWEAVPPDVH